MARPGRAGGKVRIVRRFLVLGGAILLALGLTACFPDSRNPLSGAEDYYADTSVVGSWYGFDDEMGVDTWLTITQRTSGVLDVTLEEDWGDGEPPDISAYSLFWTNVADYSVVNVESRDGPEIIYMFADYAIGDDGGLMVWFMDDEIVSEEIQSGRLTGTIEYDEFGDYVTITDSGSAILAMIERYDRETIFSVEWGPFYRQ